MLHSSAVHQRTQGYFLNDYRLEKNVLQDPKSDGEGHKVFLLPKDDADQQESVFLFRCISCLFSEVLEQFLQSLSWPSTQSFLFSTSEFMLAVRELSVTSTTSLLSRRPT